MNRWKNWNARKNAEKKENIFHMTEPFENAQKTSDYKASRFSVAPMIDWTDRHCRFFHRLMTRKSLLYTEMIHTGALLYGDRQRFLKHHNLEHPLALQLGGASPPDLAKAARIAEEFGFDEVNLNVGCPSDRVQSGSFGACLMLQPDLVGSCVAAMKAAVKIPVTVKCRIGVDNQDTEAALSHLVAACITADIDGVIVHARKAWLQGLSPKENRDIPPLNYDRVYRLKKQNPTLPVSINGGIRSLDEVLGHLTYVDGVMVGRMAYQEPAFLLQIDRTVFGTPAPLKDIYDVLEALEPYIASHLQAGGRLHAITRHLLGLFNGQPGARLFRRHLATAGCLHDANLATLRQAVDYVRFAQVRNEKPIAYESV